MIEINANLADVRQRTHRIKRIVKQNWLTYSLLVPALLVMGVLVWGSLLNGIWMTFHSWNFLGQSVWVGLENYQYVLGWDTFWTSVRATLIFGVVTFIQIGLAIIAAVTVEHIRFRNVVRTLFVIPYAIPGLVSGTMWVYLLDPDFGPIIPLLVDLGILDAPLYWGANGTAAMGVIMFASAWAYWPLAFIIISASVDGIPESHYETAKVYGANKTKTFFHVTLPQLKGAILIAISLRLIYNLTKVSQPLQITGGGPGFETSILGILVYRFTQGTRRYGLAMTVGVLLVVITLLAVIPYIRSFESDTETGGMA